MTKLSAEGEAKAKAWIAQQRETAEAWKQVEELSRFPTQFCNCADAYLARALLDLREMLMKHEENHDAHGGSR
jgi:hypothetical protein